MRPTWLWPAFVALGLASGAIAQTDTALPPEGGVQVTPEQLTVIAAQLLQSGATAEAASMARALLERDPNDLSALAILAQAEFLLGNFQSARQSAIKLYRLQDNPADRFQTARLIALASANEERFTLATFWLRIALTQAPTEEAADQTRRDASNVSRANPWQTTVRLSFAPSRNVNGGTTEDSYLINGEGVEFGDFDFNYTTPVLGLALSGIQANVSGSTRYTFSETQQSRHSFEASLWTQIVRLSADARDILDTDFEQRLNAAIEQRIQFATDGDPTTDPASVEDPEPAVDDSHFNFTRVDLAYNYETVTDIGLLGARAGVFSSWQGGGHDANGIQARISLNRAIDPRNQITGSLTAERRWAAEDGDTLDTRYTLDAQYRHRFEDAGTIGLGLAYMDFQSPIDDRAFDRWTVTLSYIPAEPIGQANVFFQAGYSLSDYDIYRDFINVPGEPVPILSEVAGGRQDERIFARVIAGFSDYSYAGFYPVVSVDLGRTTSNIGRFDQNQSAFDLSFQSSF